MGSEFSNVDLYHRSSLLGLFLPPKQDLPWLTNCKITHDEMQFGGSSRLNFKMQTKHVTRGD